MKNTTQKIINQFPQLKPLLDESNKEVLKTSSTLSELEKTFLQLARFFEKPNEEAFSLQLLYQHLEDEWLEFALQLIVEFFRNETYLIKNPNFSIIRDSQDYYTQSDFARFLQEKGFPDYTQNKVAVYKKRGKFPKEDILIAGKPYWSRYTAEIFLRKLELEKKRKESKNDEEG